MKRVRAATIEVVLYTEGESKHALPGHCMNYIILHGYNIGEQQIIIVL
jgi:hypothetical protein